MMHGHEKSDSVIVAAKPANKVVRPAVEQSAMEPAAAELVEPRTETKGNAGWQSTHRTQCRVRVSQALDRIRQVTAVLTRGRSRMRESCMYGSVRGAASNGGPYRDRRQASSFTAATPRMPLQRRARLARFFRVREGRGGCCCTRSQYRTSSGPLTNHANSAPNRNACSG
jgi:hypothetical protein